MTLQYLWGFYTQPTSAWKNIQHHQHGFANSLLHALITALIPAVCAYVSAVHIGWSIGAGEVIKLTHDSAFMLSVAMYGATLVGVFALSYLVHWMAKTFGAAPSRTTAFELSAYTATPLLMAGTAALYPELWFVTLAGLSGLTYSIYLLYTGVPILMQIQQERGFVYASSVVTCGLILLVCMLAATAILWSSGFSPVYTH